MRILVDMDSIIVDLLTPWTRAYRAHWPESKILTIKYPYNTGYEAYDLIANNWKYPEAAWETILDYLL